MRWLIMACVVAWAYCGCSPTSTKAAAYAAELQACVAGAATKAESAACRCRVSTAHGRPCDDAGAP